MTTLGLLTFLSCATDAMHIASSDRIVRLKTGYWLHAIDRFTGEAIDQRLEAVYE
jgi:hypothetical protein